MAKMQNPKTPRLVGKITKIEKKVVVPKAAKQVAAKAIIKKSDSLMNESQRKKIFAGKQMKMAEAQKKVIGKPVGSLMKSTAFSKAYKEGGSPMMEVKGGKLAGFPGKLSPEQRIDKAKKMLKSASSDSAKSVAFKKLLKKK